jgi:hypothetical protein
MDITARQVGLRENSYEWYTDVNFKRFCGVYSI